MKSDSEVRVRFAPSPTGYLHVGGLRTALYNYLFARKHGGAFILRIEDTDRTRFVEGARENLVDALRWAGLDFDEGPGKDGPAGPYVQSERLDLYATHAMHLLDAGHAYPCFCAARTAEERGRAPEGTAPAEDPCRAIAAGESRARMDAGEPYAIRFRTPRDERVEFRDELHGDIAIDTAIIDDQVLLKADGFPTYHLANVVDDHLMRISHVIRGEEWLPSTPKHVLLYRAFGWRAPAWIHLPLLLNADHRKLSKREGDVAVEAFRAKGYLPEALVNFIALLGWHDADDRELYTLDELVAAFSFDRVSGSGAVFNIEKLDWFNERYIAGAAPERLVPLCTRFLADAGRDVRDGERIARIVMALKGRFSTLERFVEQAAFFFERMPPRDEEARDRLRAPSSSVVLTALLERANAVEGWSGGAFKALIKDVQQGTGIKGQDLFMPIRIALTGSMHGPDLSEIVEILGPDECRARLNESLS